MVNIVENFVSKAYQDHIAGLIERSELPLFFNLDTVSTKDPRIKTMWKLSDLSISYPQFTHNFIKNYDVTSTYWPHIEPIVFGLLAKNEVIAGMRLWRCKLNLNSKATQFSDTQYFTPHVDVPSKKGITAIYYINDSDGDTLFFDETMTITDRITPKKGTLVYFDNKIYHAGQPPRTSFYRSVINFN